LLFLFFMMFFVRLVVLVVLVLVPVLVLLHPGLARYRGMEQKTREEFFADGPPADGDPEGFKRKCVWRVVLMCCPAPVR
jgi:hypothetical protein